MTPTSTDSGSASNQHYIRPGQATHIGPDGVASINPDDYYFKIPGNLWFDARIVELNSAELVAYLALLSKLDFRGTPTRHPDDREWVWWSESEWDERIHLSRDTRYNGFNGLVNKNIVAKESERVHGFDYDPKLRRRKYALIDATLDGRN